MNTKVANKKNNKGFTLIELIVVIAIIAVLAAILAPQYLRYVEKSRVSADASTAGEIKNAVQVACSDEDVFTSLAPANSTASGTTTSVIWENDTNDTKGIIKVGGENGTDITSPGDNKLAKELNSTFGGGNSIPRMKSKTWKAIKPYKIDVTINNDSTVTLSDNAPAESKK